MTKKVRCFPTPKKFDSLICVTKVEWWGGTLIEILKIHLSEPLPNEPDAMQLYSSHLKSPSLHSVICCLHWHLQWWRGSSAHWCCSSQRQSRLTSGVGARWLKLVWSPSLLGSHEAIMLGTQWLWWIQEVLLSGWWATAYEAGFHSQILHCMFPFALLNLVTTGSNGPKWSWRGITEWRGLRNATQDSCAPFLRLSFDNHPSCHCCLRTPESRRTRPIWRRWLHLYSTGDHTRCWGWEAGIRNQGLMAFRGYSSSIARAPCWGLKLRIGHR